MEALVGRVLMDHIWPQPTRRIRVSSNDSCTYIPRREKWRIIITTLKFIPYTVCWRRSGRLCSSPFIILHCSCGGICWWVAVHLCCAEFKKQKQKKTILGPLNFQTSEGISARAKGVVAATTNGQKSTSNIFTRKVKSDKPRNRSWHSSAASMETACVQLTLGRLSLIPVSLASFLPLSSFGFPRCSGPAALWSFYIICANPPFVYTW